MRTCSPNRGASKAEPEGVSVALRFFAARLGEACGQRMFKSSADAIANGPTKYEG